MNSLGVRKKFEKFNANKNKDIDSAQITQFLLLLFVKKNIFNLIIIQTANINL